MERVKYHMSVPNLCRSHVEFRADRYQYFILSYFIYLLFVSFLGTSEFEVRVLFQSILLILEDYEQFYFWQTFTAS